MVLAVIFGAAVMRAEYVYESDKRQADEDFPLFAAVGKMLVYLSFAFLPALLLPGGWGLGIGLLGMTFGLFVAFSNNPEMASAESVLKELTGVVVVFLIILVANYSIF